MALICLVSFPGPDSTAMASPSIAVDQYAVHFLPNYFFRLCVGDSHYYAFMVKWIETEDPEPIPVDENGLPYPVPLKVYHARVTATNGTVNPSDFYITSPSQTFRFNYTAQSEGQETLQVTLTDGASGEASKTLQIIGTCNYDLSFFAKERGSNQGGSFEVAFNGEGSFSLDSTAADSNTIKGNGTNQAALGMWAEAPGAFFCSLVPMRADSTFKIEGTLRPDYSFMTVSIYFDPMTFPGNMHFDCSAMGLGDLAFDIPVDSNTSNMDDMNMVMLTFPITGGVDHFNFGKSQGTVIVTLKK